MWYKNIKDTRPIGGCACNKLAHWPDTCFKGGWCQLAAQQEFWTSEKQVVTPRTEQAKLGRRQSADRHMSGNHLKKTYPGYLFQSFIEIQEQGWACSEIASKQQTIRLPHLALPAIWMLRIDDGWKYPSAWDCQHPRCKWTLQCNITGKHQLAANVRLA